MPAPIEAAQLTALLAPIRALDLPTTKSMLVGGAALAVWGIKPQISDYDIIVTPGCLINEARKIGLPTSRGTRLKNLEQVVGDYGEREVNGHITIMLPPNDALYRASFTELKPSSRIVQGIRVLTPEGILAWKQAIGRKKDEADIRRIINYLSQHGIAA